MATADNQRITVEPFEEQLKVPQRRTLQTLDPVTRHQRIAVDTHKAFAKLVFQRLERFIEQDFTAFMALGHVFVVGNKVDHLIDRDQLDAFAGTGADVAAGATARLRCRPGKRGQLNAVGPMRLFQGGAQVLGIHRFEYIADAAVFEGLLGELFWRYSEHHRWRQFALAQFRSHLQPVQARHADVE